MEVYHIIQLNPSKYVIFDVDFNKLDRDGKVLPENAKKEKCILTLGATEIFIKKHKAFYFTYLPFKVPQLRRVISKYGVNLDEKTK